MDKLFRFGLASCALAAAILATACADHWADLYSSSVSFDSGRVAAVCGRYNICVWDVHTGRLNRRIKAPKRWFSCLTFSPDGREIASGSDDGSVTVWDSETGTKLREFSGGYRDTWAFAVAFSHDGSKLAAAGWGWPIRIWNVNTGQLLTELQTSSTPTDAISFSPDDQMLASGSDDGSVRLFAVASRKLKFILHTDKGAVRSLAFSPNGKLLVSGSGIIGFDSWNPVSGNHAHSRIDFWDVTTSNHMTEIHVDSSTSALAFSPDGKVLASGGDGTVRIWDWASRNQLQTLSGGGKDLNFSRDGKILVSANGSDSIIRLLELSNGKEERRFSCYKAVWPWN